MSSPPPEIDHASRDRIRRVLESLALWPEASPPPSLAAMAAQCAWGEDHFRAIFTHCVGIGPKRFLENLSLQQARDWLRRDEPVLTAALAAGLSGSGRLHDLCVKLEAATPGEIRQRGAGLQIRHGTHPSPFGLCTLALAPRGICAVRFSGPTELTAVLEALRAEWPKATWIEDPAATQLVAEKLFPNPGVRPSGPLPLWLRGTNFQIRVWEALLRIPEGHVTSYQRIADAVGHPRAVRAAASAVGDNPVAWIIPCHRVLRSTGAIGGYRWGPGIKRVMLAWEAAGTGSVASMR